MGALPVGRRLPVLLTVVGLVAACATGASTSPPASMGAGQSASLAPSTLPSALPTATARPTPVADAWVRAGALNDDRVVPHLVLLGTGEVLVVGADNVCEVAIDGSDSAEVGNPLIGEWSMTARLPSRRVGPVVVALADGRALVTAGMTGENEGAIAKSSTVVFDPATRKWSSSGLLDTARINPAAAVLRDGRVLVAGGLLIDGTHDPRGLESAELWDPTRGTWSRTGSLAGPRIGAVAVTLTDGRALVVGGLPGPSAEEVARTTAETYDPATGRWTSAGTLAAPRAGFSLVALQDGGALVIGGSPTWVFDARRTGEGTASAERFDAASRTWSRTNDMAKPAAGAAAVTMQDGRVLVVAGTDAEIYDPATGTWSATRPIPDGRNDASAVLLDDGSVLVAGGWSVWVPGTPSCPDPLSQLWRFVPGSPSLDPAATPPTPKPALAGCPTLPVTIDAISMLTPERALACFGDAVLTFEAYVPPRPHEIDEGRDYSLSPAWLNGLGGSVVALSAGPDADSLVLANVPPDLGRCDWSQSIPECPFRTFEGQRVSVSAHFDDPVARTCRAVSIVEGSTFTDAEAVAECRQLLIVLSVGTEVPSAWAAGGG